MSNDACFTEFGVISPTLYIFSMIAILCFIYQFAKSMKSMESGQNKALKNLGFTLFSTQMMYCMVTGSANLIWAFAANCNLEFQRENYDVAITLYISIILYAAQYNVMVLLLFYRLRVVFHGTTYQLSRFTKWAFLIMYILSIILVAFSLLVFILSRGHSSIWAISAPFAGLCLVSIIFFLTFLFVIKLIAVNKHCDGTHQKDDNKLLSTITKQSILTLISIASLLASVTIFFLLSWTRLLASSINAYFVLALYSLVDIWTNFICIFLSYGAFNAYYSKMCGCCDTKCKQLCGKLAKPQKHEKIQSEIIQSFGGDCVQITSL